MSSREKKLRIPAALAVALLVPGTSGCTSAPPPMDCICFYVGPPDGGSVPDAGALPDASVGDTVTCSGADDPLFKNPLWSCGFA